MHRDESEHLGVELNVERKGSLEVKESLREGSQAIKRLNGTWWHKEIKKKSKFNLHNIIVNMLIHFIIIMSLENQERITNIKETNIKR